MNWTDDSVTADMCMTITLVVSAVTGCAHTGCSAVFMGQLQ